MKTRLLKKVKKRYKIVYTTSYSHVLDLKEKKQIFPVRSLGYEPYYQTQIREVIILAIGKSLYYELKKQKEKKLQRKRELRDYIRLSLLNTSSM